MRQASAVIIFGPPGSGKSTQANLLADTLAYEVVDTGRIVNEIVHDPARQDDPAIALERENYDAGRLMTPSFVVGVLSAHLKALAERRVSCVIGGSPRTMGEAEAIMPGLVEGYGLENVHAVLLEASEDVRAERNRHRSVCTVCGRPQLATGPAHEMPKRCRACGGALYVRTDVDKAGTREEEYRQKTVPAIAFTESLGIKVARVDGAQGPAAVFGEILDAIDRG